VIIDDQLIFSDAAKDVEWFAENRQSQLGVERFRIWAEELQLKGLIGPEDLLISTNVDEILSRSALETLRWCQINSTSSSPLLSGALWMPLPGRLSTAVKSEFSVLDHPHSHSQPSIYRLEDMLSGKEEGLRKFSEKTPNFVLGGAHLSAEAFLPTRILKELSATEKGFHPGIVNIRFLLDASQSHLEKAAEEVLTNQCGRADDIDQAADVESYVPWFLACNPQRFPYWFGNPDPRIGHLAAAMAQVKEAWKSDGYEDYRVDKGSVKRFEVSDEEKLFPFSYHPIRNSSKGCQLIFSYVYKQVD